MQREIQIKQWMKRRQGRQEGKEEREENKRREREEKKRPVEFQRITKQKIKQEGEI